MNSTGRKTLDVVGNDPRVVEVRSENNGYWAELRPGWRCQASDCHTLQGGNVRELLDDYRAIVPCDCDDCRHEADVRAARANSAALNAFTRKLFGG